MKRLVAIVTFLLAMMAAGNAAAASEPHAFYPLGTLLPETALNAAAASRTFYVGPTLGGASPRATVAGYSMLVLELAFTHAANGAITTTCTTGQAAATASKTMTTCTIDSGTCTLNWAGVMTTPTLTASKEWSERLGIGGYPVIKCVVSHGGTPTAADKIVVTGYLVAN